MVKNTVLLFTSSKEIVDVLSDEEAGKIFKAILAYQLGEEPEKFKGALQGIFLHLKQQIDYNNNKYEETSKKRSEARKKKAEQKQTNDNKTEQKQTNAPYIDNDIDNGIDNGSFSNEKEIIKAPESKNIMIPRETQEEIKQAWNSLGLDQIREISKKREKALQELIVKYGIEGIHEAIEKVRNAPFLKGEIKKDYRVSFDWFLKGDNFLKTLEGAYDEGKGKKRKEDLINDTSGYGEINGMYDGFADSIGRKAEQMPVL